MTGKLFDGKVAIVTGGAGGIGAEVSRTLAHRGAAVVVADIDLDKANVVADEISGAGDTAAAIHVDLADEASIAALISSTTQLYGGVDILDNNAALTAAEVLARDQAVAEMDVEVWDQMMAVNLRSQMLTCKHAVPVMVSRGGGAVVNMSSGAAYAGDLIRTAYSVSKAGIETLTKFVATQYGRQGVRANTIVPGLILTEPVKAQIPADMLAAYTEMLLTPTVGEPRDLAELVSFLVSPASSYLTGQSIHLDGGMSAHTARLSR